MSEFLAYASVTALMFVSLLLMFIVLLQRGRGGGLAGALGGAGGQSALGTKAGDVFTKITIVLAAIWILLACLSIYAVRGAEASRTAGIVEENAGQTEEEGGQAGMSSTAPDEPAAPSESTPAESTAGDADTAAGEEAAGDDDAPSASDSPASNAQSGENGDSSASNSTEGPALGAPPEDNSAAAPESEEPAGDAESK